MNPNAVRIISATVYRDERALLLLGGVVTEKTVRPNEIPVTEVDTTIPVSVTSASEGGQRPASLITACVHDLRPYVRISVCTLDEIFPPHLSSSDGIAAIPPHDAVLPLRCGSGT